MRAPRSDSTPTSSASAQPLSSTRSMRQLDERRTVKLAALEHDIGELGAGEVRLFEPAVAEHDPRELRVAEAGEVRTALGEDDVVPRRLGELDAGQPAEVKLDAPDASCRGSAVGEVARSRSARRSRRRGRSAAARRDRDRADAGVFGAVNTFRSAARAARTARPRDRRAAAAARGTGCPTPRTAARRRSST